MPRGLPVVYLLLLALIAVTAKESPPPKDLPAKSQKMPKHLRRTMTCSICETVVDEVEGALGTEKHKVQVSWRMDDKKYVEQARSEARVTELLEDMPDRFGDYGVRDEKGPGGKSYDKLVPFKKKAGSSGGMTISGGVSISAGKQDEMRLIYEWMTENHLDDMVNFFRKSVGQSAVEMKKKLCVDFFKSCPKGWFDPQPEGPAPAPADKDKDKKKAAKPEAKKPADAAVPEAAAAADGAAATQPPAASGETAPKTEL